MAATQLHWKSLQDHFIMPFFLLILKWSLFVVYVHSYEWIFLQYSLMAKYFSCMDFRLSIELQESTNYSQENYSEKGLLRSKCGKEGKIIILW